MAKCINTWHLRSKRLIKKTTNQKARDFSTFQKINTTKNNQKNKTIIKLTLVEINVRISVLLLTLWGSALAIGLFVTAK